MPKSHWKKFEERVEEQLEEIEGFKLFVQPTLPSGARPDFILENEEERIVLDAKDKLKLDYNDVDKLLEDAEEANADRQGLIVSNDTEVSEGVREYMEEQNVVLLTIED